MKVPSSYLFTLTFALSLLGSTTAVHGEEIALNFELQPQPRTLMRRNLTKRLTRLQWCPGRGQPLYRFPAGAGNPPMRSHSPSQLPGGVYRKAVAVSLQTGNTPAALLPPAPPWHAPPMVVQHSSPQPPLEPEPQEEKFQPQTLALDFGIATPEAVQVAEVKAEPSTPNLV